MRDWHALAAPIEWLSELGHRAAALARIHGDHGNAREHVLDAMVKLCDQQALVLVSALALRNVNGQALDAYTLPSCVELGRCCFLEPHFPAVGADHAEGDRVRRAVGADTPHVRFEARAVRRVNPRKKVSRGKGRLRVVPQNLCRVLAAMRRTSAGIPLKSRHRAGPQRLLQPRRALTERSLVPTPLCEQRG